MFEGRAEPHNAGRATWATLTIDLAALEALTVAFSIDSRNLYDGLLVTTG